MYNNNIGFSKDTNNAIKKCIICNQAISESDLVFIQSEGGKKIEVHFNCYIEIQEKLCSECGMPFLNQEKLLFCNEHREYFHSNKSCLAKHIDKHTKFSTAIYDASKNRITLGEQKKQTRADC